MEIIGKKIVDIRPMTSADLEFEGWEQDDHHIIPVIELEGGILLYPSRDDEGNGPGVLFGRNTKKKDQQGFYLQP